MRDVTAHANFLAEYTTNRLVDITTPQGVARGINQRVWMEQNRVWMDLHRGADREPSHQVWDVTDLQDLLILSAPQR